jgi:hypothetical protein
MPSELWHAQEHLVLLALARLSASVDPLRPDRGLHDVRIDAQPLAGAALLEVDLPPVDAAAAPTQIEVVRRGGDLSIAYSDRPQSAMSAQIYWRAASHTSSGALAAIELVVSVETSLLDSNPTIFISSHLPVEETLALGDPRRGAFSRVADGSHSVGYLLRLSGGKFSYAEMVHPGDAHESRCETSRQGTAFLRHQLFSQRLEKGVILRARVLGVVLDRAGDENAMVEHFAAFESSEPPLTT